MMDKIRKWEHRSGGRYGRGLFMGLILVGAGGTWLLGSLNITPQPISLVLPALLILTGLAVMFRPRSVE